MTTGYIDLPLESGGGGGGGVTSINGDTSAVQFIDATGAITATSSGGVTTISTAGDTFTFAGFDGSGLLESISGWQIAQPWSGANVNLNYQPNNLGNFQGIQNLQSNVDPLQASPNDISIGLNLGLTLDPNSTGFALGTAGTGAYLHNINFTHHGTSNTGNLGLINSYSDLGNGTDPIDIKGIIGYSLFGDFNSGVNFSGGLQGFIFQPTLHAGCTISTMNAFCQIFTDSMNAQTQTFNGYYSFNSTPQLGAMLANSGYSSFQANPTIGVLNGNSSANMFYAGGTFTGSLGDGTGGGYTGVQVNPNFTLLDVNSNGINIGPTSTAGTANWTAININDNVTTTGQITGLQINGPETAIAINSQGLHTLQSQFTLVDNLGQQYGNVIGGTIIMPDGTAITGTDTIANNFAFGVHTGDGTSSWTAASIIGLSCVGFVGEIDGAGTCNGPINFCLGGFADAHTGHIDSIRNFAALAIPEAAGTVDEHILFYADMPFGLLNGSSCWGVRVDDSTGAGMENHLNKLAISTATKKVSNASCALEIGGTTATLRNANMTTTQRLALTPLAGMQVYDTTLNQMAYYNGTTWVVY